MIDEKTVAHIADLAKLHLDDSEIKEYSEQLSEVLKHFETLSALDTNNLEAMHTPSPMNREDRVDENKNKSGSETSLVNAPDRSGNLFKVPPVV